MKYLIMFALFVSACGTVDGGHVHELPVSEEETPAKLTLDGKSFGELQFKDINTYEDLGRMWDVAARIPSGGYKPNVGEVIICENLAESPQIDIDAEVFPLRNNPLFDSINVSFTRNVSAGTAYLDLKRGGVQLYSGTVFSEGTFSQEDDDLASLDGSRSGAHTWTSGSDTGTVVVIQPRADMWRFLVSQSAKPVVALDFAARTEYSFHEEGKEYVPNSSWLSTMAYGWDSGGDGTLFVTRPVFGESPTVSLFAHECVVRTGDDKL